MTISIGGNGGTQRVLRRLTAASDATSRSFERLSSGSRINRASDDAAGLAVASSLNFNRRVFTQAVRNLNDGISAINIADQTLGQLSSIVIRQRELATQSANGSFSSAQRISLDVEAQTLANEYRRILSTTRFNNLNLLDGSLTELQLQAGFGSSGVVAAQFLGQTSGIVTQTVGTGSYTTQSLSFGANNTLRDGTRFLVGDLNGDGIQDLVALKLTSSGASWSFDVAFLRGLNGSTSYAVEDTIQVTGVHSASVGSAYFSAALTDVNSDGRLDLDMRYGGLGVDFSFLQGGAQVLNNSSPGGTINFGNYVEQGLDVESLTDGSAASVSLDLNNDGVMDLVDTTGQNIRINTQNTTTSQVAALVTESLLQGTFSILTASAARSALDSLQTNLELLLQVRSRVGASESRALVASNVLRTAADASAAAEDRIRSVDIAAESSQLTRQQILQTAATSLLAQVSLQPRLALTLLNA